MDSPRGRDRATSDDSAFEPLLSPKEYEEAKEHTFREFLAVAWQSRMLTLMPMLLFYVAGVSPVRMCARARITSAALARGIPSCQTCCGVAVARRNTDEVTIRQSVLLFLFTRATAQRVVSAAALSALAC